MKSCMSLISIWWRVYCVEYNNDYSNDEDEKCFKGKVNKKMMFFAFSHLDK